MLQVRKLKIFDNFLNFEKFIIIYLLYVLYLFMIDLNRRAQLLKSTVLNLILDPMP